jgi:hypothetical protein
MNPMNPMMKPSPTRSKRSAHVVATRTAPPAKASRIQRRDATGHLDAGYAADLHARSRASEEDHSSDLAFLRTPKSRRSPLAAELGREAVMTMTSGEDQSAELQDVALPMGEEMGGPFVPSAAAREYAPGEDRSNPSDATREPFPTT